MREYLEHLREEQKMPMQDVADKLGISRQYYQLIEKGERQKKMDITLAVKLADIFSLSLEDIISLENKIITEKEA